MSTQPIETVDEVNQNLRLKQLIHREQLIREITAQMRQASSLAELIQITATELGSRLEAEYAWLELEIKA